MSDLEAAYQEMADLIGEDFEYSDRFAMMHAVRYLDAALATLANDGSLWRQEPTGINNPYMPANVWIKVWPIGLPNDAVDQMIEDRERA